MKSLLALVSCLLLTAGVWAQSTQSAARLSLQITEEEGRKQLQATLANNGKPVENATVEFRVARTFGQLPIGKDQTLDDGTAAVPYPSDLPGGSTGELSVTAVVQAPASLAGTSASGTFKGARTLPPPPEVFPRALWAPRAPVALITVFTAILLAVWLAYAFVAAQLWAIHKGR